MIRDRSRRSRAAGLVVALVVVLAPAALRAQNQAPRIPNDGRVWASCAENVPKGATPPELETFAPERAVSGHETRVDVHVRHGRGETVMPGGFQIQRGSDAMIALREEGWVIPEPAGGSAPRIERPEDGEDGEVVTKLSLPFVPLPKSAGRNILVLPPLPITVARANGQVMTVCTTALQIAVDDPIANETDPKVKPNPPPRPQREDWPLLRHITLAVLATLLVVALAAWLLRRWLRRPKPVPVVPKELPWIVAMRALTELKASPLLLEHKYDVFADKVNDVARVYLGDRYGFDGLESTSEEIRRVLRRVRPAVVVLPQIDEFLNHTDLIKFAKVDANRDDCDLAIARAEFIVGSTTPPAVVRPERQPTRRAA
jgi:hypothetical protein